MAQYSSAIFLSGLFNIIGEAAGDLAGRDVASAGDVNNDGFEDIIVGASRADANGLADAGAVYVVFGGESGFALNPALFAGLDGDNGFKISGAAAGDLLGTSVASAGDVNNDGRADIIIGADHADATQNNSGASYVIFGRDGGFDSNINLSSLNETAGFKISGVAAGDRSGWSVASAGDIDGDGVDDFVVAAVGARNYSGTSFVVFGKNGGFGTNLNLASIVGGSGNGFRINGAPDFSRSGFSVAGVGDLDGDKIDDLIVGAPTTDVSGTDEGRSYVIYGGSNKFRLDINVSTLSSSDGFRVVGEASGNLSGSSVASAGDVNGDGFADLIIGAPTASFGAVSAGASYVVFGQEDRIRSDLPLSSLNGRNGFKLIGVGRGDQSGYSVASAGDVNGDGFDDVVIGAPYADFSAGTPDFGRVYVVFGKAGNFDPMINLSSLDGSNGFRIDGIPLSQMRSGASVSSAGDVNADGFDDLIVGTPEPGVNGGHGQANIHFGQKPSAAVHRIGTVAGQTLAGGDSDDMLFGLGGKDKLYGHGGDDELVGGTGDDIVKAGAGEDMLEGGAGKDSLEGGTGDDELVGGTGKDTLEAGAGEDLLEGGAGNDSLEGGTGDDELVGGTGKDTLEAGAGEDLLEGGAGNDHLEGGTGDDGISGGAGRDNIKGGDDSDYLAGGGSSDLVTGGSGDDHIEGGEGADSLHGDDGFDHLEGGSGFDVLRGNAGDDHLEGGAGSDSFVGEEGDDYYNGGSGQDAIDFSSASHRVTLNLAETQAQDLGTLGFDTIISIGSASGSRFADLLSGAAGHNLLLGGGGSDRLFGASGADILNGQVGNDALFGDDGQDRLNGNEGRDMLSGGGGADTFIFSAPADSRRGTARDIILDFAVGFDEIDLSGMDANTLRAGDQAFSFIGAASFSGLAGQLHRVSAGQRTLVEGDVNGDRAADFQILLNGSLALTANDLIL